MEVQADKLRTIVGAQGTADLGLRCDRRLVSLWHSTVVGKRSDDNTLALFRDLCNRMNLQDIPLITSDGLKFYERVIGRAFGPARLYGQILKTRRNNSHRES